jgi:hypothetical protein
MKESFVITEVSREDLEEIGFDTSKVSDETMERLARKLGDDYCEQLFWTSLEIIAEYLEIPKRNIKTLHVGDKVKWYDPEEEARDLSIVWTIDEIRGSLDDEDTIILITSEYGSEAEVFQSELIYLK